MSNYHTPGGSNLNGHPLSMAQAREFKSHVNPDRKVPDWMLKLVARQQSEPEVREVLDEYLRVEAELQGTDKALGFSCHGPWEDPLACMDGPCEACLFWQYDDIREHETKKEQAEAQAGYVAEYHAWVLEMAQGELAVRVRRLQQILAS